MDQFTYYVDGKRLNFKVSGFDMSNLDYDLYIEAELSSRTFNKIDITRLLRYDSQIYFFHQGFYITSNSNCIKKFVFDEETYDYYLYDFTSVPKQLADQLIILRNPDCSDSEIFNFIELASQFCEYANDVVRELPNTWQAH